MAQQNQSADGRVLRTLKDGYWDRTEVIELADGSRRVRKRTKGAAHGPWGVESLRREIRYLQSLSAQARVVFPPLLATWDDRHDETPDIGYEMPFYADHVDAGELARRGAIEQDEIDALQDALAEAVLVRLHEPAGIEEALASHVRSVVEHAWSELESDPNLRPLIDAPDIELNGRRAHGPRVAFARIANETAALAALDAGPWVRLHGDLFLENILWRPRSANDEGAHLRAVSRNVGPSLAKAAVVARLRCATARQANDDPAIGGGAPSSEAPRLILVDPVSVAGVTCGPPVFDLVKYESYATGELLALRSECVDVAGFDAGAPPGRYHFRIRWDDAALLPLRAHDWCTRFRRAFEQKHGVVDRRLYRLIDGYFSAAMAVNTRGVQRRARLLKATAEFNAVLATK
jgi:hypothetical protein